MWGRQIYDHRETIYFLLTPALTSMQMSKCLWIAGNISARSKSTIAIGRSTNNFSGGLNSPEEQFLVVNQTENG